VTPEELRAGIPATDDVAYFNTGASSPSPRNVVEAAQSFLAHHQFESPSGEGMYPVAFDAYDDAREAVAGFLGADASEIALTHSTTDGINRIAASIDWEPGDTVVRTDFEHPAGVLPWERFERTDGIDVRVVESEAGRIDRDAFTDAVEGARLVCVSSTTWNYGTRVPIDELVDVVHDAGAFVLVDAVQRVGQTPVDVTDWGADAIAASGHKWVLGTWGGGFLYVDDDVAGTLTPSAVGFRSIADASDDGFEFTPGAGRFEVGTTSPAPHVALQTAIETVESVGLDVVEDRIRRLATRFVDGLPAERVLSPASPESGLVTVDVPDPEATVERLADEGVVIRSLPDPDAVRASIHAFNTAEEVDTLIEALSAEW